MFNRIFIPPPAVHVYNNTEQKPHDAADAARLYGQMKEKAEREVADATVVKLGAENNITVLQIDRHRDYMLDKEKVRLLFTINGYTYDMIIDSGRRAITARAYGAIADYLAAQIVQGLACTNKYAP